MRPLRIAFINPCGEIGGAERSLLLLLQGLDRSRYTPVVFCSAPGRFLEALAAIEVPARVVSLGGAERLSRFSGGGPVGASLSALPDLGSAVGRLTRELRAARPDVIHTNGIKAHLMGGVCGRLLGCPVLWHMRDLVPEGRMLAFFRAASNCLPRQIVAVSEIVKQQFAGGRAASYTHIVYDAVDVAAYQPSRLPGSVRQELGFTDSIIVLAMVAHFTRWKGHLLFLDVVAALAHEGLPVAGMIIGGSIYRSEGHEKYETEVREYSRRLGLVNHVVFTGYQDCVPDFLNTADILVHPPIRPEPFGLGVIEAMALAKPVVAAAMGGPLETIEPEITGLLVPPGDKAAFVVAVRSLLADPERRATMGQRGRERVAQRFTPSAHVAKIERLYQEICRA